MILRRLACLALVASAARGLACPQLPVAHDAPNPFELQLGATNVNAALGSGKLTAAFSRCGELTVLKWPGPSYYSQLDYLASNAPDARTQPHFGALDSQGAFPGIAYRTAKGRGFTWLRDDDWTHDQRYSADTSDVLVDEMTNAALGFHVTARHFVLPDRDVLVNHYEVRRERGSRVRGGTLVFYTNFAPTLARLPFFPFADWALDFQTDFAAAYDSRERAVLQFMPASAQAYPHDYGLVNDLLRDPPQSARRLRRPVRRVLDGVSQPGVYIAFGARPRDDGVQVGFDDAPMCAHQSALAERTIQASTCLPRSCRCARDLQVRRDRHDPGGPLAACRARNGWRYEAESAFADAQDGRLDGSPIAACQANAAVARRLRFRHGVATAVFDVAIGATQDEAYELLRSARAESPEVQRAATETWWADFLAPARLPATDDPRSPPSRSAASSRPAPRPTMRAVRSSPASRRRIPTAPTGRATARSSTTPSTSPATPTW